MEDTEVVIKNPRICNTMPKSKALENVPQNIFACAVIAEVYEHYALYYIFTKGDV